MTTFFLSVLAVFVLRLVQIQAVNADALAEAALEGRLVTSVITVPRADIVDRDGAVLATSVDRFHVYVNIDTFSTWKRTENKEVVATGASDAAAILAPILGLDEGALANSLSATEGRVYLARNVTPEAWSKVQAERIAGVEATPTSERIYPNGNVAGNVLGFVGGQADADGTAGLAGLEYAFEDQMLGTSGSLTYERGGGNVVIPTGVREELAAVPGQTVVTTIDRDLQWLAQERLDRAIAETGAQWGSIVVMDTTTGEVYALADSHTVDPNNPGLSSADDRGSRTVSAVFEPGSTGKIITMAALLEEGLATPGDPFIAPYEFETPNGQVFHDSHEHRDLKLTLTGVLAQSSNTGTVQAGERLTLQQRYDYLEAFGFGAKTGVGLPGESAGILHDVDNWDGRTEYAVLFGQGVSVTALQTAQVYATVANGGVFVSPIVVQGFRSDDGTLTTPVRQQERRVISEETSRELMLMLESAVGDGTGEAAKVPGYRIAGKTGTAQASDGNGGMTGVVASFVGIAPADNPRIVVSVMLYNPTSSIYGGAVAAPVFSDITAQVLMALGVAPSGATETLYPTTWK